MLLASFFDLAAAYLHSANQQPDDIIDNDVIDMEVASVSRDWMSSSIVITIQETGSAHIRMNDVGSVLSVRSRLSNDPCKA